MSVSHHTEKLQISHWNISSERLDQLNYFANIKQHFKEINYVCILIALGILYHPVYVSLDFHLFAKKYFEYSEGTLTLGSPRTPFFIRFSYVFKSFIYTVICFLEK